MKGDIDFFKVFGAIFTRDWVEQSNCIDNPDEGIFLDSDREEEAQEYCSYCPSRFECLEDSLHYKDGGHRWYSEKKRKVIQLHRNRHRKAFEFDLGMLDA